MKTRCFYALLALAVCLSSSRAFAGDGPPNWKVIAAGTTVPGDDGFDLDTFAGKSSHLGKFTGEGAHSLDRDTGFFVGFATYTAANGDQLDVIYTGHVVDPFQFPVPVEGDFEIVGGTGRFTNATGCAQMTGGFTGVPGDLVFELEGTLNPQGKKKK